MILEYYVMQNEAGHILHQFRDVQPGEGESRAALASNPERIG